MLFYIIFSINFLFISSYLTNELQFFLGNYKLRKSNDIYLYNKMSYLQLNENDNIKVRTIINNGFFATKISRSGKIKIIKNNKYLLNLKKIINLILFHKLNENLEDNNIDIQIKFNVINEYSYSFIGIEFPEIRIKNDPNYNKIKIINVKQKGYTLYVEDEIKNYYLFDLYENPTNKLPFIETAFTTLVITDLISHIFDLLFDNMHI